MATAIAKVSRDAVIQILEKWLDDNFNRLKMELGGGGAVFEGGGSPLTVKAQNGFPTVTDVEEIRVTNGTLTDEGSGIVSIDTGGGSGGTGNCLVTDDGTYFVVTTGTGNASIEDDGTFFKLKDNLGNYLLKVEKTSGQMLIKGALTDNEAMPSNVIFKIRKSDGQLFIKGALSDNETL